MLEPAHPLFLPDEDDDEPVQVSQIQVTRMENGQQVFAPRVYPASELQSLEQIVDQFGGGHYILIARYDNKISSRRKIVLPGKPKPMYDEAKVSETETKPAAPSLSVPATTDPMMSMIMMMMQGMMQQQAQAAQSQTQMFIAMMQGNQQSSSEEKAQARAELQANIERERISSERTMGLMREMMQSKGGAGGGEDFTRGVEFMRSFATQQIEALRTSAKSEGDTDWGGLLETLGQVMQGVGMLKGVGGGMPEGIPEVVAEAAQ